MDDESIVEDIQKIIAGYAITTDTGGYYFPLIPEDMVDEIIKRAKAQPQQKD